MKVTILILAICAGLFAMPRTVVRSLISTAASNVPVTLSNSFCEGEITSPRLLLLNGTAVPCQWDVKRAWPDGSIKHALLSFVIPALAGNDSAIVQYGTAPAPSINTPISTAGILATDFDARVTFVKRGVTYAASARELLQAATTPMYWLSGPIATEVILRGAPKSAAGIADSDLVVQFEVRFYQGLQKARVSIVVENVWEKRCHTLYMDSLVYDTTVHKTSPDRDSTYAKKVIVYRKGYSVTMSLGQSNPVTVFTQDSVTHFASSRWRKVFTWGNAVPAIRLFHDIPYLITTGLIPRYKIPGIPLTNDEMTGWRNAWFDAGKSVLGSGTICTYMATTGERHDIGPNPEWISVWLVYPDVDSFYEKISLLNAEQSGSFPMHRRESDTTRIISAQRRPYASLHWHEYTASNVARGGVAVPVGPANHPYTWGDDHEPNLTYVPYLLTGDYYYLEEMYFHSSHNYLFTNYGSNGIYNNSQIRGMAWGLRDIGQCAALAPDAHAYERDYFNWLIKRHCEHYDSVQFGTTIDTKPPYQPKNPLGWWANTGTTTRRSVVNCATVADTADTRNPLCTLRTACFMDDFVTWTFDYLVDLGFNEAVRLRDWKLKWLEARFCSAESFNPHMGVLNILSTHYVDTARGGFIVKPIPDAAMLYAMNFDKSCNPMAGEAGPVNFYTNPALKNLYVVDSNLYLSGWGRMNAIYGRGVLSCYNRVNNPKIRVGWEFINGIVKSDAYVSRHKWDFVPGAARTRYETAIETGGTVDKAAQLTASPNPFNPQTVLRLPASALLKDFTLKAYDLRGRLVCDLTPQVNRGTSRAIWNASSVPSGMYLVRLSGGGTTRSLKLMLLK